MRDDLHHSLPLRSPWRAAARAACVPDINGALADALTRAVWSSAAAWLELPWGKAFVQILSAQQPDMFGQESLERAIAHLERTAPDHFARRACEIANAALITGENQINLVQHVLRAVLEAGLEDGIESVAARIDKEHPGHNAAEVRRRMYSEIHNCDLSAPPGPKKRARKATIDQDLSIVLPANL